VTSRGAAQRRKARALLRRQTTHLRSFVLGRSFERWHRQLVCTRHAQQARLIEELEKVALEYHPRNMKTMLIKTLDWLRFTYVLQGRY
jgi:hypothetical protein